MKAADAAGLVATGTGDVVQPPFETSHGPDILQLRAIGRCLAQRGHDVGLLEYGMRGCALTLNETKLRLQIRRIEPGRRRRDRAMREELFWDQDGTAIERDEMFGIE